MVATATTPVVTSGAALLVQEKHGTSPAFGTAVTIVLDDPPTPGNMLVLCEVVDQDGPSTTVLDNGPWTLVGSDDTFAGNSTNWPLRMYWQIVGGATSDTTTIDTTAAVDTGTIKAFILELSGVDSIDAVVRTTNSSTTTASLTPTAGLVAALISATARRTTGTNVLTPASGMTEIAEIGASPFAVNYRMIASTTGSYTVGSTGASANSAMKAAAFTQAGALTWVDAPDTIDDDDGTSDTVDDDAITETAGPFWRYDAGAAESIEGVTALLGFENTGSVTVLLQGATLADFSDADTLAVLNTTASGSYADDVLDVFFDAQGPYRYRQLVLDSASQGVRVYEVTFDEPEVSPPTVPPGQEPGKAILEIYVHDEDASRWGVATWATGPATGTEGIWSAAGWQDVTPQGVTAHIQWGSRNPDQGILSKQNGASWNVETYDPDRVLDPGNPDSPWAPQLVAGTPIRISHDSTTIRTGYIDRIGYKHKRPDYRGQLLASDTIALLNQAMVPEDSILGDTLLERVQDAINAAGIAVGGIPLPPGGPAGPAIAPLDTDNPRERSVWDHITAATEEVLWIAYVDAAAGLGLRSWGAPLDRSREINAPNLEDLEAVSSEDGTYSVARVQGDDPDVPPIERETAPLPRYGRRVIERSELTLDPEGWATAVLAERAWPGVRYVPGTVHCWTRADVDYFGTIEIMERVSCTVPGVVSVTGRVLGGELWVRHDKEAEQGATWQFQFAVATDGSSAIGITTLVADGTGDTLVDDATETDYLEAD